MQWLITTHAPSHSMKCRISLLDADPDNVLTHFFIRYRHCGQHTVETMPEAFTTLKEAYLYLGLLVRRALHHLATMEPYSTEATDDEQESISSFIQ